MFRVSIVSTKSTSWRFTTPLTRMPVTNLSPFFTRSTSVGRERVERVTAKRKEELKVEMREMLREAAGVVIDPQLPVVLRKD